VAGTSDEKYLGRSTEGVTVLLIKQVKNDISMLQ
jgi:hypothetical protein